MPEGDTIYRAARTLHAALAGQVISHFETALAPLAEVDRASPVIGRSVEKVAAAGRHLLMTMSGGLVLRTHMRRNGSWHIYRPGEKWQRSPRDMRIVVANAEWVAVAFNVYAAEFIRGLVSSVSAHEGVWHAVHPPPLPNEPARATTRPAVAAFGQESGPLALIRAARDACRR